MKTKYVTSGGWVINPRKLKSDDRVFLQSLDLASESARVEFVDECVAFYPKAWGIDLIDTNASFAEEAK
jgi:hypothetical protein